jgi:phosphoglucomutase/phosphomannomutase
MHFEDTDSLIDTCRVGFASQGVAPAVQEAALAHLHRWLSEATFQAYRAQIVALIERHGWATLLDSFYQVLPFGTGGRRGSVGVGPNRYNPWTLGASVQGHAAWLRRARGNGPLRVVIAHDVRRFADLREQLVADVPCPVFGLTSRDFAEIAAEVYAAAGIACWLPPIGQPMSTPELSFAIRHLQADGGLNISASHNPPDDNGGKFYNSAGGQEVPPRDEEMAREVAAVGWVDRMPLDRARHAGLISELPPEVYEAYLESNLGLSRRPEARSARVVFTGLHGTGRRTVAELLRRAGFHVELEPTQAPYDGAFTHVPFRAPNPEVPRSMDAAVTHAEKVGADIVMACDPDADRLGLMVRQSPPDPALADAGRWRFFSGNEIAALVAHYALSTAPAG